uniref:Uncharacterized protein n=1 Tax=Lepeophtheirus salmonis TaxID=72036 RepID=A0A0K2TMD6_LEPSM
MSYSSSASSENKDINNIRIILIRDYPSHGKKVIFDSASTFREQLMENSNLDEYDQIYDNYGYKVPIENFKGRYQILSRTNVWKLSTQRSWL